MAKSHARLLAALLEPARKKKPLLDPGALDGERASDLSAALATAPNARTVSGTSKADRLFGTSGNDVLSGLAGNDLLDGRKGRDRMTGGAGNDTYIVDNVKDRVTEKAKGGTDHVKTSVTWTLGSHVENLTLTGSKALNGFGNNLANTITGNSGDNLLDGMGGADRLAGGKGNDIYRVDHAGDRITEKANQGIDTVRAYVSWTLGAHLENLMLFGGDVSGTGNDLANRITGTALANRLDGDAGNDTLLGGGGDDTLFGGTGADSLQGSVGQDRLDGGIGADIMAGGPDDDVYFVDEAGDVVIETANAGTDTVWAEIDHTLGAHVERLVLTGGALRGTGNDLANTITGNAGNNTLDGGAGADVLQGGAGDDLYLVDDASDEILETFDGGYDSVLASVDYVLGDNAERLTLVGAARVGAGNARDNTLVGNALANSLTGGEGNDTLDGGAGADVLQGGTGNDLYRVDDANDEILEAIGDGYDSVEASVDYVLGDNVERLVLIGAAVAGTGNAIANTIVGNALANSLTGGEGNDTLDGGEGNDSLDGGSDDDSLHGGGGDDTLTGSEGHDILNGDDGNDSLDGGAGSDSLAGGGGNDTLFGGAGFDTLVGGAGDDTYEIEDFGDLIVETEGGTDTVRTTLNYMLGNGIENLVLLGMAISGRGNDLDNTITGNAGNNTLEGSLGDDTLDGGEGNDVLIGGEGNDTLIGGDGDDILLGEFGIGSSNDTLLGGSGNDTLEGHEGDDSLDGSADNDILDGGNGNDTLYGGEGNDTLVGGNGDDSLNGGEGSDTLVGGSGDDIYIVDNVNDVVSEAGGTDTVRAWVDYTLHTDVENLVLLGAALSGTGNDLANAITGNALANELDGGDGSDTLHGGAGDDTLEGGFGNDSLVGGIGNDTYAVDVEADEIVEEDGEGIDLVLSAAANYTLGAHVENLTLIGTAGISGTGNGLDNVLIGNAAANILEGGGGNDTLDGGGGGDTLRGGAGNDVYIVDNAGDIVDEQGGEEDVDTVRTTLHDYALADGIEVLVMLDNSQTNYARGNALANDITTGNHDDHLFGGGGNDTLRGGLGHDSYYLYPGDENDVVVEAAGAGHDRVFARFDYVLPENVEELVLETTTFGLGLRGTGNDLDNILTGFQWNDTLYGGDGNDYLSGGIVIGNSGLDSLVGGNGNDTYVVDRDDDIVIEEDGRGTDLVLSGSANYTLSDHVENLTLTGTSGINGTGNDLDNVLTGNAGANLLDGGGGNDTLGGGGGSDGLRGGLGDDVYIVDSGDTLTENSGEGTDTVQADFTYTLRVNFENLALTGTAAINGIGNGADNRITGNASANILSGLAGADTLDGGLGRDTFVFSSLADLNANPNSSDVLSDFDHSLAGGVDGSTLDVIDLSPIDPITGGQNNSFSTTILTRTAAPGQQNAGTLYYDTTSGVLYGFVGAQGPAISPSFAITVGTGIVWDTGAGGNIIL